MDQGPNLGGGEALALIGNEGKEQNPWFDWNLINQYAYMNWVKIGIVLLLMLITTLLILKIYRIKTVFKQKGLSGELETISALRQRDVFVLQSNKLMKMITNLFEKSIFKSNPANKDYIDYNLKRANIRVIGGGRPMVMEEFYSTVKMFALLLIAVAVLLAIFVNVTIGFLFGVIVAWASAVLPLMIIRMIVKAKNETIRVNFFDVYCKLHYSLMAGGVTPINKLLQIYAKTTDDPEMLRFVDNCCNLIETYNEYAATTLIADDYREIASVGKLMRLVKQQADGADIKAELIGFREELISEETYRLSRMVDRDIAKVQKTFMLLIIMLVQAVISAASIYFPDMGILTSLG